MNDVPHISIAALGVIRRHSERTVQRWFEPYAHTKMPMGYPVTLVADIMRQHGYPVTEEELIALTRDGTDTSETPESVALAALTRQERQLSVIADIGATLQDAQEGTHHRLDTLLEHLDELRAVSRQLERIQGELDAERARVRELEALVEQLRARRWWQRG